MAATDAFASNAKGLDAPYDLAEAITPHDTNELAWVTRAIYVGGAGNITCTVGKTNVTFTAVPVGTVLRVRSPKVLATGTTATNLVGLS